LLRYFRINDPYRLVGLLVLFVVFCLPLFLDSAPLTVPELDRFLTGEKVSEGFTLYTEIMDDIPPLAAWWNALMSWMFGRSATASHIIAFVILFLQSAFFGIVLIDKKAFPENTYVPSLIFMTLTLISFDFYTVTPALPAFGFLLLALNNLFKEIEFRSPRDETVFNLGLYVSIASLLDFSYVIYLPGVLLILALFTRSNLRRFLLLGFGFLLPHLVLSTLYFIDDEMGALWSYYYREGFRFISRDLISFKSLLILCSVPLFYLLVALFIMNRDARLSKYQSQLSQAMFVWFLVSLAHLFITDHFRPQSLLVLIPSASFFFTHFLLLIRRRKFAEMNIWILLVGILAISNLSRYGFIKSVDYSRLMVRASSVDTANKSVLMLTHDFTDYQSNTVAPPFTDSRLSLQIFQHPEFYENVLLVNRLFEVNPPEVIIDPDNLMKPYLERLPVIRRQYKKTKEGYQRISN
jgi:hypothetical protein